VVTQINLGGVFQSGGSTVVSGGSSGLDIEQLVNDLVAIREISITNVEDKVALNDSKIGAFSELQSLLETMKTAMDFLRNPAGIDNDSSNVFKYLSVNMTATGGIAPTDYISVTVSPGTDPRVSDIEVTDVALAKVQSSDTFVVADADTSVVEAASTANRFTAGVMELNNGVTVTLDAGDSLNEIAQKINTTSETSGVRATVVRVNTGEYKLQLKATDTGTDADFDVMSVANTAIGGVMENIAFADTQTATNASIIVDGITITSQNNVIDDAIDGITFTVKQKTLGEVITASIVPDSSLVKDAVNNFINAYNEIKVFAARQNERDDDGILVETAILGGNQTLSSVVAKIDSQLNRIIDGISGGDPDKLADIGITFTDYAGDDETPSIRNVLTLDESKFADALATDFDAFRKVFEFQISSDNPYVDVYSRTNDITISDFSVTVDTGAGTATVDYTDDTGAHTISMDYSAYTGGAILTGQDGTALEGLVLIYADTANATFDVSLNMGIADGIYNAINDMNDEESGIITAEVDGLGTTNDRFEKDITRLEELLETYRETLLDKFSALERAIAGINTLLQALDAQDQTRYAG
jgi:flagellar hook-associated protein 2